VKILSRAAIAVVAVALFWAGFAYAVTKPADASSYLRSALQVAEATRDAAVTGALIGRQQLDDRVFGAFAATAYDDAIQGLAGAAKKLADQPPPDAASARLRDELLALVQTAVVDLGDAAATEDDGVLRTVVEGLTEVAARLADLIERYRA
jgi:hypothetical protein